jgi:hypothetical protein
LKNLSRAIQRCKEQSRSWLFLIAAVVMVSAFGHELQAQEPAGALDATHLERPVELNGIWMFKAEERPADAQTDTQSGALAYSAVGFDDSQWRALDLSDSLHAIFPGNHPRVAWYRRHIHVDPSQTGLGLRAGTVSRAFEVYVNGERLITSCQVVPLVSCTYDAQLLARIPDRMVATGSLVVAVRLAITDQDWVNQFPGLSPGNLALGQADTMEREFWLEVIGQNLFHLLDSSLIIGLGFVALVLFVAQPRQYEYLWIFGLGMMRLAELPVQVITLFDNIPLGWRYFSVSFSIASPILWVGMYFAFVNVRIGWKLRVILVVAGLLNAYSQLANEALVPNLPGSYGLLTNLPFVVMLAIVIPIVLIVHWRRGNQEAGILMIPTVLFSLYIYANYFFVLLQQVPAWTRFARQGLVLIQNFPAGPFLISLDNVSGIASTLNLAIIMVLRATRTSRQQAQLESELEAAREVQLVMLPEQRDAIPGFEIESAYLPAQQVGGDFFQVMPTNDGGVLLVIGDVAGKGLPAAMMVSVLVGATRTAATYSNDPSEIMAQLNERLVGRSRGGFSTALAVHITADGVVTLANAGHLSPYLDGGEIESPGALPLGILDVAQYPSTQFSLAPGSRLTFYTDGVVEAQDAQGRLLGFDQGQRLSVRPAAEIVETARLFGQSDDITVVAITRTV